MWRLWINGVIHTPRGVVRQGSLLVDGQGVIEAAGGPELAAAAGTNADIADVNGLTVLPGFIDIHVHGGGGYRMMDGTPESLEGMSRFHARHGTTSFLATTETDSGERIEQALHTVASMMEQGLSGAELLGAHLEGPYLNVRRAGAQNKSFLREVRMEELRQFIRGSGDSIRLVTLAPEMNGAHEAIRFLKESGMTVSIGHSDATYADVLEAIALGASHTTHHFNGMSPLHHRAPGVAGAGLMLRELTAELIADGHHVHPAVVRLLFDCKGADGVCLITDAVFCAGLPDGDYGEVRMHGGMVELTNGESLAGSSLTTIDALRNAMRFTGYPLEKILPSLTRVPAQQIGMDGRKGTLERGKDADFVIVDEALRVRATYVRGRQVYRDSGYAP